MCVPDKSKFVFHEVTVIVFVVGFTLLLAISMLSADLVCSLILIDVIRMSSYCSYCLI